MKKTICSALFLFAGSCDALWGYTKVPTQDNCLAGGLVCQPYEICNANTEQCEQQQPQLNAVKPQIIFFDGGDRISINGSGFSPGTQLFIDGQLMTSVMITSATELSVNIPMKAVSQGWGTKPISVEVRVGDKSATRSDLLSLASNVANFTPYTVTGIIVKGNIGNIQIGDVDNDGKSDIVARSAYDPGGGVTPDLEFYTSIGNGDGTFKKAVKSATLSKSAGHFVLCDLNKDSKLDLAYWSNVEKQFFFSINPGTGIFPTQTQLFMPPIPPINYYLGVAELNGDNVNDLVVIDNDNPSMFTIVSDLAGKLIPPPQITPKTGTTLNARNGVPLLADFNGDKKSDLLTYSTMFDPAVYLGNGNGTFGTGKSYPGSRAVSDIAIADFDNDGYPDFVTTSITYREVGVFRNLKGQDFSWTSLANKSANAVFLLATDLNGDKNADILVFEASTLNPSGYAYMGRGDGTFAAQTLSVKTSIPVPGVVVPRVADINSDGRLDMAFTNYNDQNAYLILNSLK